MFERTPCCLTLQNTRLFDLTKIQVVWPYNTPHCLTLQNEHHVVWPDKTPCCLTWQNDQHHDVWPHKTQLFILTKLQFDLLEQASLTWLSAKQYTNLFLVDNVSSTNHQNSLAVKGVTNCLVPMGNELIVRSVILPVSNSELFVLWVGNLQYQISFTIRDLQFNQ